MGIGNLTRHLISISQNCGNVQNHGQDMYLTKYRKLVVVPLDKHNTNGLHFYIERKDMFIISEKKISEYIYIHPEIKMDLNY